MDVPSGHETRSMKKTILRPSWAIPMLLGLAVAALCVAAPLHLIALLVGGSILILTLKRAEVGILCIVTAIASIVFEEALPVIRFGFGSLHLTDILLLELLVLVLVGFAVSRRRRRTRTPMDLPLLLFYLAALVTAVVGLSAGTEVERVRRAGRVVTYYLLFFAVTDLVRTRRQLAFLVKGMFAIAALVAAAMVVQAAIGPAAALMPGRVEAASTFGRSSEALRILPPGQVTVYVLFVTSLCFLMLRKRDRPMVLSGSFYLALLLGVAILLTYNRTYWVSVMVSVGILLGVAQTGKRSRLLRVIGVGLVAAGLAVLIAVGSGGKLNAAVTAMSQRFASLFAGRELLESSSLEMRKIENGFALQRIREHPLLGIGLGSRYRSNLLYWSNGEDPLQGYIHNGYLWILVKTGVAGLVPLLWFWIAFLRRGLRNWRRVGDPFLQSAVLGFTLSAVGYLMMAVTIPVFMDWHSVVISAVTFGAATSILSLYGEAEPARAANAPTAAGGEGVPPHTP